MKPAFVTYHETGYCEIPAELENVSEVSYLLKGFCQKKGIDETLWPKIDLAISECLNNAIEHGCLEDPSKVVRATWKWLKNRLIVEIEDPGSFDVDKKQASLPDDLLAESGRGSFIIETIAKSYQREKTAYGQRCTMEFETHLETNPIEQMTEMYEILQRLTSDLNIALAENDALKGFAADLAQEPIIESIIAKGVDRLSDIAEITQADVWTLTPDGSLENDYHKGAQALAIREAVIDKTHPCACTTVVATEEEHLVENCSVLKEDDPLYQPFGCAIVVPIMYQRDCIGVIAIHGRESQRDRLFSNTLPLAKLFAQFLGIAYTSIKTFRQREEHQRTEMQLEVASEIQRSLMPTSFPSNLHCRSIGRCDTALAVGGDYVDAMEIRDVGLLIVIADVMGKGVPAALLATIFRTAIRSRLNLAETPGWLLSKINKQIHEELGHLSMFITAQAAFFDYGKKILKLASAGHCPALLSNVKTQSVDTLTAEGMPLGIDPSFLYEERLIQLSTGDRLLFLTDGIYEAENAKGEMLGIERLVSDLPQLWQEGLEAVPAQTFDYVTRFTQGRSAQDDQTLMALEIL